MKKKLFFAAVAIIALASCADNEFVGEVSPNPNPGNGNESAIVFSSGTKTITRATKTGQEAASLLNNTFVFEGTKLGTESTPVTHLVFDQYNANWVANTANTTESNSSDWEYVGYSPASTSASPTATQSIKYWDYATTQYDFVAYSLGEGGDADNDATTAKTKATASAIDHATKSYTLTGDAEELKACYISDLVTAYNQGTVCDYGKIVQFSFRSLAAKIRMAFYETIPGYSVKNIQFYTSDNASLATDGTQNDPTLYVKTTETFKGLPSGSGTMTITFNSDSRGFTKRPGGTAESTDYNKAHVSFAPTNASTDVSTTLVLEDLADYPTSYEGILASGSFIGRTSNTATYAGGLDGGSGKYYTILPYEDGANLLLRIKYTLVSTDGSAEEIEVDNATAVIPAELAKWSPNFAYTYIFKISDMTNGSTGVKGGDNTDIAYGLTPITLNAVVVESEDGVQETITTVSEPSITTYSEGKVVTENNEYKKNAPIYIIVNNGTSNVTLAVDGDSHNANLYTAVLTDGTGGVHSQEISEESVGNALAHGTYNSTAKTYTVTDAQGATLVLTESTALAPSTQIEAVDSPTGNLITVTGAKFTPTAAGTYVFEYVKTARTAGAYTAVTSGTTLTPGTQYFTSSDGKGGFVSDGTQVADATHSYWTETTAPNQGEYFYKIIQVVQ